MVLQRERPLPIWGWADCGEEVAVKLDDAAVTVKAVPMGLIDSSFGGSSIEAWVASGGKSGLYNAMIAPVKPLAIRGAIWYQGEKNVVLNNGLKYRGKMQALIEGWRKVWGYDFPFYFVQLAPTCALQNQPARVAVPDQQRAGWHGRVSDGRSSRQCNG